MGTSDQSMSAEIGELAAALAVAQGEMTGAVKDSKNPFYKSTYADLASVWDACRTSLSKNGLAVIQVASTSDGGAAVITTTLAHKSGQWIRGSIALLPVKPDPQGMGSAYTYARRYALAAMVGVAQVDDDGNAAFAMHSRPAPSEPKGKPTWITTDDVRQAVRQAVARVGRQEVLDQLKAMGWETADAIPAERRPDVVAMLNGLTVQEAA